MPKGYVIAQVTVENPTAYDEYRKGVLATVAAFGGRFLARGGMSETLEGTEISKRVVIIEFPSYAVAKEWHGSDAYAPLLAMRQAAARATLTLVEGA